MPPNEEPTGHNEQRFIFRPWIRHPKTGEKIWARQFGKKAFRIPVGPDGAPDLGAR